MIPEELQTGRDLLAMLQDENGEVAEYWHKSDVEMRDDLVKANHRGLGLQYQLTDSEIERKALWEICIEMKAAELHLSDWNNGVCLIDPAKCSVKRSPCFEFCLQCDLAGCEATEYYRDLAEKEIENRIEAMQ